MTTFFILVIAAAAILYGWHAAIVSRRNAVAEALGGVDAQLQQRHDLIPNVLAIAKRFMQHESDLFARITQLRSAAAGMAGERAFGQIGEKLRIESQLGESVGRLFALAEGYPQLKSDATMVEAQRSYQEVETNIAAARRFYNSAVGRLRNAVEIYPGPALARLAGVTALPPFFEAAESARGPVSAQDTLAG